MLRTTVVTFVCLVVAATAQADQFDDYLASHDVFTHVWRARVKWSPDQTKKWDDIRADYGEHVERMKVAYPAKGKTIKGKLANSTIYTQEESENLERRRIKLNKIRRESFNHRIVKLMTPDQRKQVVRSITMIMWKSPTKQLGDPALIAALKLTKRQQEQRDSLLEDLRGIALTKEGAEYKRFPQLCEAANEEFLSLLSTPQKETMKTLSFTDKQYAKVYGPRPRPGEPPK